MSSRPTVSLIQVLKKKYYDRDVSPLYAKLKQTEDKIHDEQVKSSELIAKEIKKEILKICPTAKFCERYNEEQITDSSIKLTFKISHKENKEALKELEAFREIINATQKQLDRWELEAYVALANKDDIREFNPELARPKA